MINRLDTPGGHIVVCLFLVVFGCILSTFHAPKSEDIIVFALGALGRSMINDPKGETFATGKNNKDR